MTKTFKSSMREYQRSPYGSPDGSLANPLPRITSSNGEFVITSEAARTQLRDTSQTFSAPTHEGRLVTFTANTPPALGAVNHGSNLEIDWTYRIKTVVDANTLELEGARWEFAGTGISYVIHAAADLTAASGQFAEDTGPTGTGADGENRSNVGPTEWMAVHFPTATDGRLKVYPFIVSRRTSATVLRISDPFDNLETFPVEASLQWSLRDRPAYTHEQLYKIMHQALLHAGWEAHQHRGKNNGAGAGGNNNNNTYVVQDWIYRSTGEAGDTEGFLRMAAFHRSGGLDGTDGTNSLFGIDWAFYGAWDRDHASVSISGGGSTDTNPGNGVNALSSHDSVNNNNEWAAQADTPNTTSSQDPALAPDSFAGDGQNGAPLNHHTRWGSPFHATTSARSRFPNALGTFEGGDVQELQYWIYADKDDIQISISAPGFGSFHMGMGFLSARSDSNPNKFRTNIITEAGGSPRLRIGGPGTANGTDPSATTPPYQVGDRIQVCPLTVVSPVDPGVNHLGEFIQSSTITNLPGLVPAIGILICPVAASISDGDTFVINDGEGNTDTYEFDTVPNGVGVGNIAVDISAATTADQVRDAIVTAINVSGTVNITAAGTVSSRVDLTHGTNGGVGNLPIVDTNSVFLAGTTGMDGGGYAIDIATLNDPVSAGTLVGEDPQPMYFFRPTLETIPFGITPTQGAFRVSNRSNHGDATYKDHNGPSGTPPNSNGFDAVAEMSGIQGADTREINPNERSGRFSLVTVNCRDTAGGQLRGSMKGCRMASPRLGAHKFVRDRNGDWHYTLPVGHRHDSDVGEIDTNQLLLALGPMPESMVFIG